LYNQVKSLLNLTTTEFVLKYKDNEGDMITISSDEELACALSLSEGGLLRLSASFPSDSQKPEIPVSCEFEHPGQFHGRMCHRNFGRGRGRWCGRTGPYDRTFPDGTGNGRHFKKSKLIHKRDMIQSFLNEITTQNPGGLNPYQQKRQAILQSKLRSIESRLSEWNEDTPMEEEKSKEESKDDNRLAKLDKKEEKEKRKCEKKYRKEFEKHRGGWHHHHHHDFHSHSENLSDEAKAEIAELKARIESLKEPMKEIKSQLKMKKKAMCEVNEHDGQLILCEMEDLKKQIWEYKKQICPLRQRIRQLYHPF